MVVVVVVQTNNRVSLVELELSCGYVGVVTTYGPP